MTHEVFISYSNKDLEICEDICVALEQRGIGCWYADRNIPAGADWAESIIAAIKSAGVFVLVFTEDSNASRQVLREVNIAVSAGLDILPIKLTEQLPESGMEYYLSTVHWLEAVNVGRYAAIDMLCDMCEDVLENGLKPVAAPSATQVTARHQREAYPEKRNIWPWLVIGLSLLCLLAAVYIIRDSLSPDVPEPSPSPVVVTVGPAVEPTFEPTPIPTTEPTPSPTPVPTPTPQPTPTPAHTQTPEPVQTEDPEPTPAVSPTPEITEPPAETPAQPSAEPVPSPETTAVPEVTAEPEPIPETEIPAEAETQPETEVQT